MIDAQPAGVAHHGPDGLDERLVAGGAQALGNERCEPPVLPAGVELVGRRAHRDLAGQQILPAPGVGPRDVEADGEIVHDRDRLRGLLELRVELPLQPGVEVHPLAVRDPEGRGPGAVGAPHLGRPAAPVLAVALGQRAVGGEVDQRLALPRPVPVEAGLAFEAREDRLQRLHLEPKDRVAIDPAAGVERVPGGDPALAVARVQVLPTQNLLDPQEERVAEPAAGRIVGAGLDRRDRRGGAERVDHHHAAAEAARPAPQPRQIRQIADPPAAARARRVDLRREAPGREILGKVAAPGADDDQRLAAAAGQELVVAVGEIVGQLAVDGPLGAVFVDRIGALHQRAIAPRQQEAHAFVAFGLGRFGAGRPAHRRAQGRVRGGRGRVVHAARVVVAVVDAEAIGRH